MLRKNTHVLGIPVDLITKEQVIESIFTLIEEWRHTGICQYVATLNVDFLNNTHRPWSAKPKNERLLQALRSSRIVTADGMPIVWYSRLLGSPIPERVTGADLIKPLCRACAERHKSLFLLGGTEKVLAKAQKRLQDDNPTLKIVGAAAPVVDENQPDPSLVEIINQAKPDILLINLGNPKQELWFHEVQEQLRVPVAIGIGGALSFIAGETARAPLWMQQKGLEWLFRLYTEPKRLWKRYLIGGVKFLMMAAPSIFFHYLTKLLAIINGGSALSCALLVHQKNGGNEEALLQLPHTINRITCPSIKRDIEGALKSNPTLTLDFSDVTHIDLKGMTLLINTLSNQNIQTSGISTPLCKLFDAHRLKDLVPQKTIAKQKRY